MNRLVPFLLLIALPAHAVTTRTWRVTSYKDFDEGEAQGVLLSSLGDASSGFGATRVDLPEAVVFCSTVAPDGTVWLGTGDQVQLYAFDGKAVRKVAKLGGAGESLVTALAAAPDGTIYAGTGPKGRIHSVKNGVAKELAKLDAEYVWALALDGAKKTLYAATGPSGKVFAVDVATGKNRVFWDSGEKHILSLVLKSDGSMLAGSADEAILYRIAPDGTARALHDFDGDEVRAIVQRGDVAYVAVNEFEKKAGSAAPASSTKAHGTKIVLPTGPGASSATPTSPPGRDRKGKGAVYRVDLDGRVEQLHALGDSYFTSLSVDKEGNVFAAAGANGRVYQIRPDRTVLTTLDLPERQILTLAFDGKNPLLGTGDAGSIYKIDFGPPKDATYVSKVFDASFPGRWGNLRWSSSGALTVETRAGNTSRPDKTWSAWQPPLRAAHPSKDDRSDGGEGKITSPGGRYLQFRAKFGKGATLRDVTVFYLPQNQRARVTEIVVGDDPNAKLAKAARAAGKPRSPVVKVKWRVENPDEDDLVYRLAFREETETNWKPLGGPEPLTAREWEWNTESIPDGNYVIKVVASDERANPKEASLDHALVSAPFLIDNRKPEVGGLVVAYPFATGAARDSFSPITELSYSVDGGEFLPFAPRDAVFDDLSEEFTVKLPAGLSAGTHSLAVRAVDAADNVGAVQATFRVK